MLAFDWYEIPGWFGADDAIAYQSLLEQCQNEDVVEVGSYCGRSALFAAPILQARGCRLLCVDSWDDQGPDRNLFANGPDSISPHLTGDIAAACFKRNTSRFSSMIQTLRLDSVAAARRLASDGRQFGLVFIDANHSYESVMADIQYWSPLIRPGGIICGHDYPVFESVRRAVHDSLPNATGGQIWSFTLLPGPLSPRGNRPAVE